MIAALRQHIASRRLERIVAERRAAMADYRKRRAAALLGRMRKAMDADLAGAGRS